MKVATALVFASALFATPAFAQANNSRTPAKEPLQYEVPFYQRGSGTESGGPAKELNGNWGPGSGLWDPEVTGSIGMAPPYAMEPYADEEIGAEPYAVIPVPSGKGNYAGGYRGEMERRWGIDTFPGR